jgi:hypothetical protein
MCHDVRSVSPQGPLPAEREGNLLYLPRVPFALGPTILAAVKPHHPEYGGSSRTAAEFRMAGRILQLDLHVPPQEVGAVLAAHALGIDQLLRGSRASVPAGIPRAGSFAAAAAIDYEAVTKVLSNLAGEYLHQGALGEPFGVLGASPVTGTAGVLLCDEVEGLTFDVNAYTSVHLLAHALARRPDLLDTAYALEQQAAQAAETAGQASSSPAAAHTRRLGSRADSSASGSREIGR